MLVGMGANGCKGLVVEMEHRRKSGRGVEETFFVPAVGAKEKIVLLDDHPAFRREDERGGKVAGEEGGGRGCRRLIWGLRRGRDGIGRGLCCRILMRRVGREGLGGEFCMIWVLRTILMMRRMRFEEIR